MQLIRAHSTNHGGSGNLPIKRIVMHGTVTPCAAGVARAVARRWRDMPNIKASAHYVVDPREVVRCVPDDIVAYHAPPNPGSLGIELCDPIEGPPDRWHDDNHQAMLERAANLAANLADKHNVPPRRINVGQLIGGVHGVCEHVDVTNAWHQTTHTDIGPGFPWRQFIRLVRSHMGVSSPGGDDEGSGSNWTEKLVRNLLTLGKSDKNNHPVQTRSVQGLLRARGQRVKVDGWFGPRTEAAVKRVQRQHNALVDGIVGPVTWSILLNAHNE